MSNATRRALAELAILSLLGTGTPAGAFEGNAAADGAPAPGRTSELPAPVALAGPRLCSAQDSADGDDPLGAAGIRWGRGHRPGSSWPGEAPDGGVFLREETEAPKGEASGTSMSKPARNALLVLGVEGLVALNAYLATLDTDIYGGFAIAMAPVAGFTCEGCDKPEAIVGSVAMAGIGAYNLTLDEDRMSNHDIFWKNFVAWHVAGAAIAITFLITRDRPGKPKSGGEPGENSDGALLFAPVPGGVGFHYRFRR